jgi:pimeloyl-ACP methyl ester carboxylesterase
MAERGTAPYETGTVTSADGTAIAFRRLGSGPGIVLVQGAMGSAENYIELAAALANRFTVTLPERRGRGASGPAGEHYEIDREVEDLTSVLSESGARFVFGLSSGAVIILQALLDTTMIEKAALYEPPLFVDDPGKPAALLSKMKSQLERDKTAAVLVTGMKGGQMGPPIVNHIPAWMLAPFIGYVMRAEAKQGAGGYITMEDLAPTLVQDFTVVAASTGDTEKYRRIGVPVLLLGGNTSPAFLKESLSALEQVLPRAERYEFPSLGHAGSWNRDKKRNPTGQPDLVAAKLAEWF